MCIFLVADSMNSELSLQRKVKFKNSCYQQNINFFTQLARKSLGTIFAQKKVGQGFILFFEIRNVLHGGCIVISLHWKIFYFTPIMWSLNNHRHEYFPHKMCRKLSHWQEFTSNTNFGVQHHQFTLSALFCKLLTLSSFAYFCHVWSISGAVGESELVWYLLYSALAPGNPRPSQWAPSNDLPYPPLIATISSQPIQIQI